MPSPRTWSTSGCEPLGPDVRVHPPVAEPGGVVAPAVNQPSSRTNRSTPTRAARSAMRGQPVEVVVEVDRLPDVEHHRLVASGGGQAALVGVPAGGQAVEAVVGGGDVHPRRRRTSRPCASTTSPGSSSSPPPIVVPVAGSRSTRSTRVAAPRRRGRPAPRRAGGEARGAEHDHGGRAETGAAGAALAQPQPVGDRVPLRGALALVAPGEVEQLDEVVGDGQHHLEALERVAVRRPCWSACAAARSAPPGSASTSVPSAEPGRLVVERRAQPGSSSSSRGAGEPRRPGRAAVGAVPAQVRPGEQPARVLAEQRHARAVRQQRQRRSRRSPSSRPAGEHDGEPSSPAVPARCRSVVALAGQRREAASGPVGVSP